MFTDKKPSSTDHRGHHANDPGMGRWTAAHMCGKWLTRSLYARRFEHGSGHDFIIIPAHNAGDTLVRCLRAVLAQDDDYEVIVVDDGSNDANGICGQFDVQYIRNDTRVGPAISRNRGADAARGAYLAFTDADCVPPNDWLASIRRWLEVAPVVCGPIGRHRGKTHSDDSRTSTGRCTGSIHPRRDRFILDGNVAFHREVYFNRDRLEEHFFHRVAAAEDTVVAMTIAEQHRILSTEQLWVLHMHREKFFDYVRKHITTGYSRTLLSLAFPQRKVFAARDIRLSYVFSQLLFCLRVYKLPGHHRFGGH